MKKNVLLLMASTLVCLVACNKETELPNDEPAGQGNDVITEVIGAGLEKDETKADISDGLKFSWRNGADRAGDYVAFWNGTTYVRSAASTAAAASTTFEITYSGTRSEYAYYPYYIVQNIATEVNGTGKLAAAGTTTVVLPDTYDYAEVSGSNTPCPMIAANVPGEGWAFKQLCGLLRLTVPGIPATANKLVITFDKVVTGAFNVTGADTATPYISVGTGESAVTITLTPGADYCGAVVNIPVPQGTISITKVETKVDNTLLATSITPTILSSWAVGRKHGKKATAAFTPSIASVIFAKGNLYTGGSDGYVLSQGTHWSDHMFAFSGAVEDPENVGFTSDVTNSYFENDSKKYKMKDRTHFNWNEVYYLFNTSDRKTPSEITLSMARGEDYAGDGTNTRKGYSLSLPNNYFGDDFTWRLFNQDEAALFIRDHATKRAGSKVNGRTDKYYRFMNILVTEMTSVKGTTRENGAGTQIITAPRTMIRPVYNQQGGILLFPDNTVIDVDFELKDESENYYEPNERTQKWNLCKISYDNLEKLLAKGCAFLPAVGQYKDYQKDSGGNWYRFNGVGAFGGYWTSYQKNKTMGQNIDFHDYSSGVATVFYDVPSNKYCYLSVRLVRDVE